MDAWQRSPFAMSAEDLDVHEAVMAIQRVLDACDLSAPAREALERAVGALRAG